MKRKSGYSPTEKGLSQAARLMKVLGHPARLRIMYFVEGGEQSVTAIQRVIGLTQAMTSQHLKVLHDAGLLIRRRDGVRILYRLSDKVGFELLEYLRECRPLWE